MAGLILGGITNAALGDSFIHSSISVRDASIAQKLVIKEVQKNKLKTYFTKKEARADSNRVKNLKGDLTEEQQDKFLALSRTQQKMVLRNQNKPARQGGNQNINLWTAVSPAMKTLLTTDNGHTENFGATMARVNYSRVVEKKLEAKIKAAVEKKEWDEAIKKTKGE